MHLVPARSLQILSAGLVAAGSIAISAASAPGASAAPAGKAPRLSHQLCYASAAHGFKVPKPVEFADFFNPKGLIPKIGKAVLNCNPVRQVSRSGRVSPITDAAGHLACFAIRAAREKLQAVTLANQFGHAKVHVGQPKEVCLPTRQSHGKPPKGKPVEPPGLDHFTCYGVTSGRFRPGHVRLKDSFAGKLVAPRIKAVPTMLCAPALMIVGEHVAGQVIHPGAFLTCFPVGQTPRKRKVFDLNQFGRATVAIHRTSVLCLPSSRP